ncbi:response regulator [Pigmentiphaga aceris]|uniref:histidine kinase n=1 Tax=Pigmentiphaga aceris TaxID=1940612 RepID=A0A5C0ATZ4_9BURK|nr:ATP-binding protein [Pigmentiphaga aceris]QEI05144.1 response regulator [Pigmentiphaga aceris]
MISNFPLASSRIRHEQDLPAARQRARQICALFGMDDHQQTRLATAVSEIARNALRYATSGSVEFAVEVQATCSVLIARVRDSGNGIDNLDALLSSGSRGVDATGGIVGSRRLVDQFSMRSDANGTVVDLGMILPRPVHPVTAAAVNQVVDHLARARPATPLEELERQNREVLKAVTELRRHEEELRSADRRKNEFLAMLAHELRNPLAALQNGVEYLRTQGDPGSPWRRVEDMMLRQTRQLARLVDDLLDVSRITQGTVRIKREPIEAATLAEMAAEANRGLMEQRGHHFRVEVPEQPIWLDADATRLTQALSNLLNNAARYTPTGGMISLSVFAIDQEVRFVVRDNGSGIDAEMLPRVFELFMRAEQAVQSTEAGLGIGLTIVQRMVELHNGSIQAYSDGPGQGSTFIMTLPAREQAPDRIDIAPVPATPSQRSVLIVDDNADSAESLSMLLELYGYATSVASDGQAALLHCRQSLPQVAILDIGMPGMDGYELAQRLREEHAGAPLMLVALTGFGDEAVARKAKQAGFDHRLVKPLDLKALQALLA